MVVLQGTHPPVGRCTCAEAPSSAASWLTEALCASRRPAVGDAFTEWFGVTWEPMQGPPICTHHESARRISIAEAPAQAVPVSRSCGLRLSGRNDASLSRLCHGQTASCQPPSSLSSALEGVPLAEGQTVISGYHRTLADTSPKAIGYRAPTAPSPCCSRSADSRASSVCLRPRRRRAELGPRHHRRRTPPSHSLAQRVALRVSPARSRRPRSRCSRPMYGCPSRSAS
jgi:hypothetical protein